MSQSSRTEQWLRQASLDTGEGEIIRLLGREHVVVLLGANVRAEPQGQLLFSFVVNLIARLYPVVQRLSVVIPSDSKVVAHFPRWHEPSLGSQVRKFLTALAPPLSWSVSAHVPPSATIAIVIGQELGAQPGHSMFIGSRGWAAYFSPSAPEHADGAPNPIGAYTAACIGVAELWKRVLMPHRERFPGIPIIPRDKRLVFSALTYRQDDAEGVPLADHFDIGHLTIIGTGAGGGAAAFALASIRKLGGHINAIDPDAVESTNLNRYVFADADDAQEKRPKVSVVEGLFDANGRVVVNGVPEPFHTAGTKLRTLDFRHVLAAVHSREARREIQMETPMVLWDCGAAEHGEFRVWRMILGQTECMHCKHPMNDADAEWTKARQLEVLLGLDASVWLRKIKDHEPFVREEIATIAACLSANEVSFALPSEGQRFNDWEAAQCGQISLPEIDDGVPIPFAPVMAGVLLAGEVIKEHLAPHHCLNSSYENTLLGFFSQHRRPERRLSRHDCAFCRDRAYIQQYRRRWQ